MMNKIIWEKKLLLGIFVLLSFCGTLLNDLDLVKNYYWHRQVLDLALFIALGNIFKTKINSKKIGAYCFGIYVVFFTMSFIILGAKIPVVTHGFHVSIDTWFFHVVLAVSGSIAVLNASKFIKSSKFLEYIGKQSLVFYIFHAFFLSQLLKAFAPLLNMGGGMSFFYIAIIITSVIGNCWMIAYIFDNTKLKILFGRT